MKELTIEDFKKDRRELENQIAEKLNEFTKKYGVSIDNLTLHQEFAIGGSQLVIRAKIETDI